MSKHKKQHYVPRFYFRFFSQDGHNINIYNLRKARTYTGPIKHCAAEDYFYSKDVGLEKHYGDLEEKLASILKSLNSHLDIGKLNEDEYFFLLLFILFQHSRTKKEQILSKNFTRQFVDVVLKPAFLASEEFKKSGLSKKSIEELQITYPADHLYKILHGILGVPLISDLGACMLVNKTKKDFVFSDAPVVIYNTMMSREKNHGVSGLQSIGLQIFCPLNKSTMIMLYDKEVYNLENNSCKIEITNDKDIDGLNSLQIFNCEENVFFSDIKQAGIVSTLHGNLTPLNKHEIKFAIIDMVKKNGEKAKVLHAFCPQFNYELELTFLKITKDSFDRTIRNPKLVEDYNHFTKQFLPDES